jgi:DNA-binding response OmpR family regulator
MTQPTDKHILVIEDEKPMAKALEIKLGRLGYQVTVVQNGVLGLEALEHDTFDLVLCDLIMPKVDGFGVLESIRERGLAVPVIVMTNLSQEEDEARAMSLGARDFIVKSNTPIADIMDLVNTTLA